MKKKLFTNIFLIAFSLLFLWNNVYTETLNLDGIPAQNNPIGSTLSSGNIWVGDTGNRAASRAVSGDVAISNLGATTIQANSVALTTDTTGNYVLGLTESTGIDVSGTAGEGWSPTIAFDSTEIGTTTWGSGSGITWTYDAGVSDPAIAFGSGTVNITGSLSATNLSGTNTGDQTITLTGDVTGSGVGSFVTTIANDVVTYGKIQNVSATDRLLGRSTTGAGDVEEIAVGGDISQSGSTFTIQPNSVALTTDTTGNYVATITNGSGISGSSSTEGGTPTIALGDLTADWTQAGAYDFVLNNASSELKILESTGATYYSIFDVGDLSADQTFNFNVGGTVYTSGNDPLDTIAEWQSLCTACVDVTADVTGTLPVASGGTGTTTGSITGTGALTFAAGGTNQNVTLTPSGTGYTILNGSVGIGTAGPISPLQIGIAGGTFLPPTNPTTLIWAANSTTANGGNVAIFANNLTATGIDIGGSLSFGGVNNSVSGNFIDFASVAGRREDSVDGNAPGYLAFSTRVGAGAMTERMRISSTGNVGIGTTNPGTKLDVAGTVYTNNQTLLLWGGIRTAGSSVGIESQAAGGLEVGTNGAYPLTFYTEATERMRIISGGNVGIGETAPTTLLYLKGADNTTVQTILINATQANVTASDTYMDFRSTTGSEGSITGTAVAGVLAYNTFTGSHYTQIVDKKGLKVNMLLEAIDGKPRFLEKIDGDKKYKASAKSQLFLSRISKTKGSKAVVGVYGGTDKEGRDLILSIGTGFMYIANTGKKLEIGDYLISSDVLGMAEKQSDDIYRNSTAAKIMESVLWRKNEKSRLVKVIYLGG